LSYGAQGRRLEPKVLPPRSAKALIALKRASPFSRRTYAYRPIRPSIGPAFESTLHDIAAKRAKSWVASNDLQTGRASSNSPLAPDTSTTEDEKGRDADSERDARKARLDDIDEMRREADAYTVQATELRQIADAAQPLYDTLDDRQRHRLLQFVREDLRANVMDDRRDRRP
jgi:hypothetical protein